MFAMPETGIGLFPDVGATRFLNRCPGQIGRYLGLTGARLGPADALYCGFATHFVPRERVPALVAALAGSMARRREQAQVEARAGALSRRSRRARRWRPCGRRSTAVSPATRSRQSSTRAGERTAQRMGRQDPRRAADQIADQPEDHAAPVDRRRAATISKQALGARIPADPALSWRRTISTKACAPCWSTRTRSRNGSRRPSPRSTTRWSMLFRAAWRAGELRFA